MKKTAAILLCLLLLPAMVSACGAKSMYKDGTYTAQAEDFDTEGWKDAVSITISSGVITAVDWNATHKDGGDDKKTRSQNGAYILPDDEAKSQWHEQAKSMETALIGAQDPSKLPVDADGVAENVSGVSVNVKEFVLLAQKALSDASK